MIRRAGSHSLAAGIAAATSRPHLSTVSRKLRHTILELWHAGLTFLIWDTGLLWRGVLVEARVFSRLPPVEWQKVLEDLEDFLICTLDDLKSIPLQELHLVSSSRVQPALLRDLWNATFAYRSHSDQNISIRPSSEHRPSLDASALAAELKGDRAESSILSRHHVREAQLLCLGDHAGGFAARDPTRGMKKLIDSDKTLAVLREFMESGGRLNVLRQTDLSLACVSSGLKCWGLFCDLNTELATLRWSSFSFRGKLSACILRISLKDVS